MHNQNKQNKKEQKSKTIVIVSGGMDSVTLLYHMNKISNVIGVLSFDYGQKHRLEIEKAKFHTNKLGIEHKIIDLSCLKDLLKSSLTGDSDVPEGHYEDENMKNTVVPNRNMIMLSIAAGYAASKGAEKIAYGAHSGDHCIYPDCRPEFIEKLGDAIKICHFTPIRLIAPFSTLDKAGILKIGMPLGVDYSQTLTCYNGGEVACGKCGSCQERLEAFKMIGIEDPIEYASREIIK